MPKEEEGRLTEKLLTEKWAATDRTPDGEERYGATPPEQSR
jgi:hypothetical protein